MSKPFGEVSSCFDYLIGTRAEAQMVEPGARPHSLNAIVFVPQGSELTARTGHWMRDNI